MTDSLSWGKYALYSEGFERCSKLAGSSEINIEIQAHICWTRTETRSWGHSTMVEQTANELVHLLLEEEIFVFILLNLFTDPWSETLAILGLSC